MALHIRDAEADKLLREFAARRQLSLTDAVKVAVREATARPSLYDRIKPIQDRIKARGSTGLKADKAFFDSLND